MKDERGRALPDFIIVGAMRAGSTALTHLLRRHPQCFLAHNEIHFFSRSRNWQRGLDWYAGHFHGWSGEPVVGEKTVAYSYRPALRPSVPERIAAALPSVKLVWTLRDPVARAYSQYWHAVRFGHEHLAFEQAIQERQRPDWRAYRDRGVYVDQVRDYLEFFPREQMYFVCFEEMVAFPERTLPPLLHFLGLDAAHAVDLDLGRRERNVGGPPRSAHLSRMLGRTPLRLREGVLRHLFRFNRSPMPCPPMKDETAEALTDFYGPYNEELASLIDLDTSTWRASGNGSRNR